MENTDSEDMNSAQAYSSLVDLDLINPSTRCILVRLLRTWEARNFKRNNELMSVDFLLLDEEDCLIQGSIHHQLLDRFRDKLRDGQIYLIRDFDVLRSGSQYRITDHQYMIRFTNATILEAVDEEKYTIGHEKFCFRSSTELTQLANKNEYLPDVVGFICKYEEVVQYEKRNSKRALLDIYLEDSVKPRLTIWDDLADLIGDKLKEIDERTIVIVATNLIPKTFHGRLYLNPSSATKIYLNADFQAVRDFRGRMKIQPEIDDSYKISKNNTSYAPLNSIAEILNFVTNEKEQEREFTCTAKVTEVVLRNGWNYISCSNCSRKMEKTQKSLTCNYCSNSQVVGVLRFRIELMVDDGSDSTTFVIFDKEGKKLTNTTASALMAETEKDLPKLKSDEAPASILNIVGKTLTFQVKVTPYNFTAKKQTFTVSRILYNNLNSEIEEPQKKEILDTKTHQESTSSSIASIKVEDTRADKDFEKLDKGALKRRKLQKNGKTPRKAILEVSD